MKEMIESNLKMMSLKTQGQIACDVDVREKAMRCLIQKFKKVLCFADQVCCLLHLRIFSQSRELGR